MASGKSDKLKGRVKEAGRRSAQPLSDYSAVQPAGGKGRHT